MANKAQAALEKVVGVFTAGEYYKEVFEAKKEYFETLGNISEESADFENQMDLFMGWYIFNRNLSTQGLPPIHLYCRNMIGELPPEEKEVFERLGKVRHSIYEVTKAKDSSMVLRDLANAEKVEVSDIEFKFGFSKGDIFEARLSPQKSHFLFVNGFCFHPKEAQKFIESQMKKIRSGDELQRTKIIFNLGHMSRKHQRFPHISAEHIYSQSPAF